MSMGMQVPVMLLRSYASSYQFAKLRVDFPVLSSVLSFLNLERLRHSSDIVLLSCDHCIYILRMLLKYLSVFLFLYNRVLRFPLLLFHTAHHIP